MKKTLITVLAAAALLSACTSYVKTYSAGGTLLGECVSRKGLLIGGGAACSGSANPRDQK